MTLRVEKRTRIILEHDEGNHIESVESVSRTCRVTGGIVVRGLHFVKFSRMMSRRREEAHWVPLDETLASYHVDIRGASRVLKGDLLRECIS